MHCKNVRKLFFHTCMQHHEVTTVFHMLELAELLLQ